MVGTRTSGKIASPTEGRGTMQEPVFNDTLQIGIVVRDLEATVRRYEDDYGIGLLGGPWLLAAAEGQRLGPAERPGVLPAL